MVARFASRLFRRRVLRRSNAQAAAQVEKLEERLVLSLNVPQLSSLPGADHTIYLDYDGHTVTNTGWNNYYNQATLNAPAYSTDSDRQNFSATELARINESFHRMAEDFRPFHVNVTTVEPDIEDLRKTSNDDERWGLRVIMTNEAAMVDDPAERCRCGGIAYIWSFDDNIDLPVWVYTTGGKSIAEAGSHEVGHALGLSHDGYPGGSYYRGHGDPADDGDATWASIMGVGYYKNVSTWDDGTFYQSNNGGSGANYGAGPDDLEIITTGVSGFGYRADDHSNLTDGTATEPDRDGTDISGGGIIETSDDVDVFKLVSGAGDLTVDLTTFTPGPNLDIEARLFDEFGNLIAVSNPPTELDASITATVFAGTYYLQVDGVGYGTPTVEDPTGYSDYASIGQYELTGTVPVPESVANIDDITVNEDDGTATFTVSLDVPAFGDASVDFQTSDGSATAPADYEQLSGTVEFTAGQSEQTITVNLTDDTVLEGEEQFSVVLGTAVGLTVGDGEGVATIVDNDSIVLNVEDGIVYEGGRAYFIARLTEPAVDTVTVFYSTSDGTATAGDDYVPATNRRLVIREGKTFIRRAIQTNQDTEVEDAESFTVTLSNPSGTVSLGDAVADMTILDDDDPELPEITIGDVSVPEGTQAIFEVTLAEPADGQVTVRYTTVDDTATGGSDFVARTGSVRFLPGQTSRLIRIDTLVDDVAEGNETFDVVLYDKVGPARLTDDTAVGTLEDSDSSDFAELTLSDARGYEGGKGRVLATLSKPIDAVAQFRYTTNDGTAVAPDDYRARGNGLIKFNPGQTQKWIQVPVYQDTLDEGNETFSVSVTSVTGSMTVADGEAMVEIIDDDGPGLPLVSVSDASADEGRNLVFTFTLSEASQDPIKVHYGTVDGTATGDVDYRSRQAAITVPAGETSKTVAIKSWQDEVAESDETFSVLLTNVVGPATISDGEGIGTIVDDDEGTGGIGDFIPGDWDDDFDTWDQRHHNHDLWLSHGLHDHGHDHGFERIEWHDGRALIADPMEWFEDVDVEYHNHDHASGDHQQHDHDHDQDCSCGNCQAVGDAATMAGHSDHDHGDHDHSDHDHDCACANCRGMAAASPADPGPEAFVSQAQLVPDAGLFDVEEDPMVPIAPDTLTSIATSEPAEGGDANSEDTRVESSTNESIDFLLTNLALLESLDGVV